MAGYLRLKGKIGRGNNDISYHIGSDFSEIGLVIDDVDSIQVDGDELQEILDTCGNLPTSKGRVVRYFGDHAKFIAANVLNIRG